MADFPRSPISSNTCAPNPEGFVDPIAQYPTGRPAQDDKDLFSPFEPLSLTLARANDRCLHNTGRYEERVCAGQQAVCNSVLVAQPIGGAAISQVTQPHERRLYYSNEVGHAAASIASAIFSAVIKVGKLVSAQGTTGNTDASTTRRPPTPRTLPWVSVTAIGSSSDPMRHVQLACLTPVAVLRI